jgi:hypothetical protein
MRRKAARHDLVVEETIPEHRVLALAVEALKAGEEAPKALADSLRRSYPGMENAPEVARTALAWLAREYRREVDAVRAAAAKHPSAACRKLLGQAAARNLPRFGFEEPLPLFDEPIHVLRRRRSFKKYAQERSPIPFIDISDSIVQSLEDAREMAEAFNAESAFEALVSAVMSATKRDPKDPMTPEALTRHVFKPVRN